MASVDLKRVVFGTDGWRDIIADGFTVERVRWVAQATADWLRGQRRRGGRVLVGYDGRFQGERFALAAAGVLTGNGFSVDVSAGPVPTPAISWWIMEKSYAGGLMVTASHNPPAYSGIKIKPNYGGSADESIIEPIVRNLGRRAPRKPKPSALRRVDFMPAYRKMLRNFLKMRALRNLRGTIIFDPMGGAQAGQFRPILKGLPVRILEIHPAIDPSFYGIPAPEPVGKHLGELQKAVRRTGARIGIATDGDGDRIGVVADGGKFLTPHIVFALLVLHMITNRRQDGAIVKTVSGSFLIDRIARAHGRKILETPVGFKHICRLMRENDVMIGGEESGGIGFKGYLPERDGLMSGLLFLELMGASGKSCSRLARDLAREFGKSHYGRIDTHHTSGQAVLKKLVSSPPNRLAGGKIRSVNARDGLKLIRSDDSWLLFRASGTEPLLRIYAESASPKDTRQLLAAGVKLAGVARS